MSDTTEATASADAPREPLAVPRTVNLVIVAVFVEVFFLLVRIVATFGFSDQLQRLLIKSNTDLKTTDKNRKDPHTYVLNSQQVLHDLHNLRYSGLWQGLIIALALALLAFSLRKSSTASVTRWALLIVMVMTGGPLQVIPAKNWPAVIQIALVASGVASLAAIVLLFVPDSRNYFRAIAEARRGQFAQKQGRSAPAPRPSLRSILSPPKPVSLDKPEARAEASAQARGARSKSRAEAEAVARGAQLARERAKASKSRKTEV